MLCINTTSTDIYNHLATEEYLLKNRTEDFFMLWQSDRTAVLGKHQQAEAEIDLNYARQQGIRIARRYSGGGCVYHDLGNLNLTFIQSPIPSRFSIFGQILIDFLRTINVRAETDSRMGLSVNGLKISGSAQCIYKNRSMYHCTLLYRTDLTTLNATLTPPVTVSSGANFNSISSVKSEVANLCSFLPGPPDIIRFKTELFNYFLHREKNNSLYVISLLEQQRIARLKQKYASREWIEKNIRQSISVSI